METLTTVFTLDCVPRSEVSFQNAIFERIHLPVGAERLLTIGGGKEESGLSTGRHKPLSLETLFAAFERSQINEVTIIVSPRYTIKIQIARVHRCCRNGNGMVG